MMIKFNRDLKTLESFADKRFDAGDFEGALGYLLDAKNECKRDADIYEKIATAYFELDMYKEALQYLYKALDAKRLVDDDIYDKIIICYNCIGNTDAAEYYAQQAKELFGGSIVYFDEEQGMIFEEISQKFNEIKEKFDTLSKYQIVYPPEKVDHFEEFQDGNDALNQRDYQTAIEKFSVVTKNEEFYESARIGLALAKYNSGNVAEAIKICEEVYDKNNACVIAACWLAVMHTRQGNDALAQKYFSVIDLTKINDEQEVRKIAMACCESGKHDLALKCFKRMTFNNSFNVVLEFFYGAALFNTGNFEESRDKFARIARVTDGDAVALYYCRLADRLIAMGAKSAEPIPYVYHLPDAEEDKIVFETTNLLCIKNGAQLRKKFSEKRTKELIDWCFDYGNSEAQKGACFLFSLVKNRRSKRMLEDILLDPFVDKKVKEFALNLLVVDENEKTLGVVIDDKYKKLDFYPLFLEGDFGNAFTAAYALVYAHAATHGDYDERKIYDAANAVYYENLYSKTLKKSTLAAIAGCIWVTSKVEDVYDVAEVANTFGCEKEELLNLIGSLKNHE